ncbi:MAG: multidrug efflux SMR transporter [Veillonella sp.]|uniref:DMT family transporter n=1 Tax=Veillonella sp. TaxID=1926307 RepID=UPI0029117530|nr:multidrug efflux SMR transporter [Veillonella sp.]MDU5866715.1 multidrug efflux SMR transporter [Veillonella sp.]
MLSYFLLALSIGLELFATTMLKASDSFTRPLQTIACVCGYVGSFYTLTHVLKYIPLSVTYATWSGVGLVVTALISVFIFSEGYNIYTILGIALIVVGVVILNLWGSVGN